MPLFGHESLSVVFMTWVDSYYIIIEERSALADVKTDLGSNLWVKSLDVFFYTE